MLLDKLDDVRNRTSLLLRQTLRGPVIKGAFLVSLLKRFHSLDHRFEAVGVLPDVRLLIYLVLFCVPAVVIQERCQLLLVDKCLYQIRKLCSRLLVVVIIRDKRVHEQ